VCGRESDSMYSSQVRLSVGYEAQSAHAGPGHGHRRSRAGARGKTVRPGCP